MALSGFGTIAAYRSAVVAKRLEDLVCWQLADELKRRVFAFTASEPAVRDSDYCEQIRDAARSATRNIAEGFGRFRPSEFAKFLTIARGSLLETCDHLIDGIENGYI